MLHETTFKNILITLRHALEAETLEEARHSIAYAIKRTERLSNTIMNAAAKRGRKGGLATAERGPEYFKRIAAMRKTKGGGRPKKHPQS